MKYKKICGFAVSILVIFVSFSCASTNVKENSQSETALEPPALFDDWQYKGFETEYPAWCEAVLQKKDISELVIFFPQLAGHENEVKIQLSYGMDIDMCLHSAMEEDNQDEDLELQIKPELIAKSWVRINPVYTEYEFPYVYIRLYLYSNQEEPL